MSYILLGIVTGVFAGFFGVGGGIILVPALIWIFHFSQHEAQGISLATILIPATILGAISYYKQHPFPLKIPLLIAAGIFLGAYVGGMIAQQIPAKSLKISFGVLMLVASIKMIFGK